MSDSEKSIVTCPESMDISVVAEFSIELKTALEAKQAIQLQAANVERADTAGLQMLCAFFLDAQAEGVDVEWLEPSDALLGSSKQIGLAEHLKLH